jgi:hypothetical protein
MARSVPMDTAVLVQRRADDRPVGMAAHGAADPGDLTLDGLEAVLGAAEPMRGVGDLPVEMLGAGPVAWLAVRADLKGMLDRADGGVYAANGRAATACTRSDGGGSGQYTSHPQATRVARRRPERPTVHL